MDNEMIERCANEISKLLPGLEPNTMQSKIIVLTIITAMREPTDKMLALGPEVQAWPEIIDAIIGI